MGESHFRLLLPALRQRSQLTTVSFCDNGISMTVLKDLLHHTSNLSQVTREVHPAPLEYYDGMSYALIQRFVQLCSELNNTLRTTGQSKLISFVKTLASNVLNAVPMT